MALIWGFRVFLILISAQMCRDWLINKHQNKDIYQSSTAQQDHEDYEGLKVVVFYNGKAGSSDVTPGLSSALGCVYVQEWTTTIAVWK